MSTFYADLYQSRILACCPNHVICTGLGNTVADIDVTGAKVFSKTLFSMVIPEVEQELEKEADRKSVILFGIEVSRIAFIYAFFH